MGNKQVNIDIPESLIDQLDAESKRTGKPTSCVLKEALRFWLGLHPKAKWDLRRVSEYQQESIEYVGNQAIRTYAFRLDCVKR